VEEIKGFMPPDIGDDDHIVRRMGWAAVRQWHKLPAEVQNRIRKQAVFVHDRYETVQLNEQIGIFIAKHGQDGDA
jgi:hypothetical protein